MGASKIIQTAIKEGRESLLEPEALELCRLYEIPTSEWRFAEHDDDAARMAKELGFPVVMKIVIPERLDKSEVGGIETGLRSSREVKARFKKLVEAFKGQRKPPVLGVILQKQVEPGIEVIIGSIHDPQFGPCVMMGLGGDLAQIMPEATFRMVPLTEADALSMLTELADGKLLVRLQGYSPTAREILIRNVSKVAKMMTEQDGLDTVELNPLILHRDQGVVVGAKASLKRG